jgi:hypothetical protein
MDDPNQRVIFGTSGHRGSSLRGTFTEAHILAVTQAICDYRQSRGTYGPLSMGKDTHAVSAPAQRTALEVLAANGVETMIQRDDGFTPTPAVSHAILSYNKGRSKGLADGIVITPSHNPPEDGGFKYNPTNGGPADTDVTRWVQDRANELLRAGNREVRRISYESALKAATTHSHEVAWHIPADAPTAQSGEWVPGPQAEFFNALRKELDGLPFIAEDLGLITPEVRALRDQFQLPGTKVLQFAFDGHSDNSHLPHNYVPNMVVYTGTHDNNTTRGWFEDLPDEQQKEVWRYLKQPQGKSDAAVRELIRLAWSSAAALAMVPLQDLLGLGREALMNVPGSAEGNWRWRTTEDMLSSKEFEWLGELTRTSNRFRQGIS